MMEERIRNLIAAAHFAVEQIEQMKGMFSDEDGLIQQSIDDVHEASDAFKNVTTTELIGEESSDEKTNEK